MRICFRGSSATSKEEQARAIVIDEELRKEQCNKEKEVKLLLLGSGESGKSTFAKQMKILFQGMYHEDELRAFTFPVWANCLTVLKAVVAYTTARDVVATSSQVHFLSSSNLCCCKVLCMLDLHTYYKMRCFLISCCEPFSLASIVSSTLPKSHMKLQERCEKFFQLYFPTRQW